MTTEQQNTNWACLPKETRTAIRLDYNNVLHNPRLDKFDSVYLAAFENIFGKHNLTSDTEPEEMLTIPRKDVQEFYAEICKTIDRSQDTNVRICSQGKIIALKSLFGDKCLPDKDSDTDVPKPKFSKGDSVLHIPTQIVCDVVEYRADLKRYKLSRMSGVATCFAKESDLEPYTDPSNVSANEAKEAKEEAKDNMKMEEKETKNYPPYLDYPLVPTKKEKELDLCELLKGCEGVEVFLPDEGEYIITEVFDNEIILDKGSKRTRLVGESLILTPTGFAYAYPSKDSFIKHPLDAYSAWQDWKEVRKPKYVLQVQMRLISNHGKTIEDYECVEVEMSDIDLTQAAEAVRECLMKLYEQHTEQ